MTTTRRKALITGASAGIGATFARQLAAQGHDLLLVARRGDRLQSLADELSKRHQVRCEVLSVDLTSMDASATVMAHLDKLNWHIDFLISNAGLSGHTKFAQTPWSQVGGEMQLMMTTLTELTHRIAPGMIERRWGRIINVTSVVGSMGNAGQSNYAATKAGAEGMARSLARELGSRSITVNCVAPGFIDTDMTRALGEAQRDALQSQIPLGRLGEPDDVAAIVAFLAST